MGVRALAVRIGKRKEGGGRIGNFVFTTSPPPSLSLVSVDKASIHYIFSVKKRFSTRILTKIYSIGCFFYGEIRQACLLVVATRLFIFCLDLHRMYLVMFLYFRN